MLNRIKSTLSAQTKPLKMYLILLFLIYCQFDKIITSHVYFPQIHNKSNISDENLFKDQTM